MSVSKDASSSQCLEKELTSACIKKEVDNPGMTSNHASQIDVKHEGETSGTASVTDEHNSSESNGSSSPEPSESTNNSGGVRPRSGIFGEWPHRLSAEWQTAEQLALLQDEDHNGDRRLASAPTSLTELCVVCGDRASGRHYGAISCEGCKGFFKRSIRKQLGYTCRGSRDCEVNKHHRNRCQYCRLQKCLAMGMRSDSVQSERKPIDSKDKLLLPSPGSNSSQRNYRKKDLSLKPSPDEDTNGPLDKESIRSHDSFDHSSDLSTLAHVVTTLAAKNESDEKEDSSILSSKEDQDSSKDSTDISKAFDTIAKVAGAYSDAALSLHMDSDDAESLFEIEGPLLMDFQMAFHLQVPNPAGASYLNVHYICESASRLLFLSVHWARSIHAFQLLRSEVQVALMRGCWSDLFTLGLAQCSQALSLATILSAIVSHLNASIHQDKLSASRVKEVTDHIRKLQAFVNSLLRLQIDDHEYAYLKAIVLFGQDHLPGARQVEKFQEKAYQELRAYICQSFPANSDRFPKLLLRLMSLRSLSKGITEELFFAGLIGSVQIDSIIPYILKMETTSNHTQPQTFTTSPADTTNPASFNP